MQRALALLLAAAAASVCAMPAAAQEPFRVFNRTGVPALELNAVRSPRGAGNDWGRNLLSRPLGPDGGFPLRPSDTAGCRFDLRLLLADGREAKLQNQDVCALRVLSVGPQFVGALPGAMGVPEAVPPGPEAPNPPAGAEAAAGAATSGAGRAAAAAAPPSFRPNPHARVSSGTGFVVGPDRVLTNHHVINGCNRVLVRTADGRTLGATPPARVDVQRDLALLAVPGNPGPALPFRGEPAVRRGEAVVTYGFPLAGLLSSGPTLTTGEVSALSGIADHQGRFQVSAPMQPGNSGGPLLDRQGNVVGVAVAKLNAAHIAARTGDIPQNVNFAIKGSEAVDFLRRAGVALTVAESRGAERSAAEVGETAHRSTVLVRCEM
jgi:S1-C subfamily serine protease